MGYSGTETTLEQRLLSFKFFSRVEFISNHLVREKDSCGLQKGGKFC